jgi:hypothetical protein
MAKLAASASSGGIGSGPLNENPVVQKWAKKQKPYHQKVFGVIQKNGDFGAFGGPKWVTDISQVSAALVKSLSESGAKLPNSYPLPLCAHGTEKSCVAHQGCKWDPWKHCYCYLTLAPSPGSSSSSAAAPAPSGKTPGKATVIASDKSTGLAAAAKVKAKQMVESTSATAGQAAKHGDEYQFKMEHVATPASPYDGTATAGG